MLSMKKKTPEGVKSAPKEPNDIFIILSPYFECKDCGELGCPYNPDVPAELAEAIDQYTQSKLKAFAGEVEEAIGEDLPPCWAHDSRDDGEDYQGVDSVEIAGHKHYPCSTNEEAEQFNLRLTEQRQALKAIKEKAGIE